MPLGDVNYIELLLAGVSAMVVGFLWYGPLFGKRWMQLVGMTKADMERGKANMGQTYLMSYVGSVVMAYVLNYVLGLTGAASLSQAAVTAFWMWLGFVATTGANEFIYAVKPRPWELYWLNQANLLVTLAVMAGVLVSL